jgi:uncharacterized protein YkwD
MQLSFPLAALFALCATAQSINQQWTDDQSFRDAVLNSTNFYRSQHNASALNWNDTLVDAAQDWSDGCVFEHSVRKFRNRCNTTVPEQR